MEPTQTPPSKLRAAYDYLKQQDVTVPDDYNEFEQGMQDPARLQKLYGYFKEQDVTVPDSYDDFAGAMLADVKKKPGGDAAGPGLPSTPNSENPAAGDQEFLPQTVSNPDLAAVLDPVQVAEGATKQYAPGFTGPVPVGTYERPSDKGTPAQGTQYVDAPTAVGPPVEAADVADDGFWASLGKSLYNGLDPKRIGGNLLDYGGDLLEVLGRTRSLGAGSAAGMAVASDAPTMQELAAPLTGDKYSDTKAAELLARAQAGDLPLSQAAQQSILSNPSLASAGNMLGSGVASIVPVAAATAIGGPLAGATVGGGLGISATKDAARSAGIGDEEAALTATVLAPIQAALEAVGVKDPGVAKLAIRATLREAVAAGGGKLTAQALGAAAKKIIPEVGRRVAGGAAPEAVTEFLQGEAEGVSKLVADQVRSPAAPGRYGVTPFDALVKSPLEQAVVGAALGGGLGVTHGGTQVAEAPTEFATPTVDERYFDYRRPTGQTELSNVQVVRLDESRGMATVRGQDGQGKQFERDVPAGQLYEVKPSLAVPAALLEPTPGAAPIISEQAAAVQTEQSGTAGPILPAPPQGEGFTLPKPVRKDFPADEAGDTAYTNANIQHWDALASYINNLGDGTLTDAEGKAYNVQATAGGVWVTDPSNGSTFFKNGKFNKQGSPIKGDLTFEAAPSGQPAPPATPPATTLYAPVQENPRVAERKVASESSPTLAVAITPDPADPTKASFTLNPQADQRRIVGDGLSSLGHFFDYNQPIGKIAGLAPAQARRMELRDGEWHVTQKAGIQVQDDAAAQVAPTPASPASPEPSPVEAPAEIVPPPPPPPAPVERAALPEVQPDPASTKPLTAQQQSANDALDALDRYNALDARAKKGKPGSKARAEVNTAAQKAGLTATVKGDLSMSVTRDGKRATRFNEYTATTPAANHVPLAERPAEARPFLEKVVATAAESPEVLQGLGIAVRGKNLSARELSGAVEDIQAGRNTMRAQLVLDALETAHQRGYVEKSEGNGLATRRYTVPVEEYVGDAPATRTNVPLSDGEVTQLIADDPAVKAAIDAYVLPDGSVDYGKLAKDARDPQGGSGGLQFLYDLDAASADKLKTLADERARPSTDRPADPAPQATSEPGSPTQGSAGTDGASAPSPAEVAPPTLAEQNVAAKQEFADALAEFRAARKKGNGTAQSSILGVPAFSAEEAAALTKMAKAAVKLGAVKTKQVIARLRAQGLTDDDVTDDQLRPFVKQLLANEGIRQPKMKQAADNPTEATEQRAHAKRYDEQTQAALTGDERNYVPSKTKIAASESPADYIARVGAEEAYQAAIGTKPEGTEDLLHDNLIRGVAEHYTSERNSALKAGNTDAANAAQERLMRLVGALAKTGTAQAQALQARVGAGGTIGDLVDAKDPAATGQATVNAALGEIANRNVEGQKQNDSDAAELEKQAKPKRERKMAAALDSVSVKAAIDKATGSTTPPTEAAPADVPKYGDSNKFFTKAKVAEWRKQIKGMAFSSPLPAESVLLGAYHLEASTRKFADWSAKMIREAGAKIRPRLSELYELSKAELLKKDPAASGFNTPEEVAAIVGRQQAPGAVREGVKELGKRLSDIAKQHASDTNTDRRTLTKKFIEDAGLSGKVAGEVAAAIESEWNKRVEKSSWQTLRGRFQPKRTRAKLDALNRLTNDLNAASNLPETTMRSPVAQLLEQLIGNNVPVSATEAQHIERLKDAYIKAAKKTTRTIGGTQVETQDTKAVAKAAMEMLGAIGKLKNVNQQVWGQEVGAMFYASLLSSPTTHLANAYLNTLSTSHEVGAISTIHTAADAGLSQALKPLLALFPGYKRGAADAYDVATTGIDLKSKTGGSLTDKDFQSDPLEEHSVVRGRLLAGLQRLGIGKGWSAPEKSSARIVRRSLGASDTFFQGGLAEARAKEIAVKMAVRAVERRQANGGTMTGREVRQFIADETDRILFNTPEAIADINAIVASEGLGSPKTVAEMAARNARVGDLLDQARAAATPELVADSKEFAARHAGNSEYEGHLGRFAYALADTFKGVPAIGKIIVPFAKVTSNFQNRYAEWSGLGFYRAVQGGAGKPVLGKFGEIDKRFVREYTPEEQEKAFLRSTIGTLVGLSSYALVKAGYIAITGMASGNKDEDKQRPAQSIVLLKGPLAGTSFTYKGMNEEIALTTLSSTLAWAKKKHLAEDDPDVADRMEAVALLTAASTMNLGPSNGAGDFLGTISKVGANPEAWFKAVERMGMTGAKSMLMPSGVSYAANLLSQATDADLPQKQSNEAWQQFKLQVWGDVPSYLGGPDKQDALDIFGDPMKYATNRIWGTQPVSDDPHKSEIKLLLVDKGLMPDEIRISDRRLRLYDPISGDKVTPLTNKEYHDFCEARGKAFYRELTENGDYRLRKIREAKTPKAALKPRDEAIETATNEARNLIEAQRATAGAAAKFKLSKITQTQKELRLARESQE